MLFLFQEEMGISCELLESDFLKCSVGFPFMRSKSKVRGRDGALPLQQTPSPSHQPPDLTAVPHPPGFLYPPPTSTLTSTLHNGTAQLPGWGGEAVIYYSTGALPACSSSLIHMTYPTCHRHTMALVL